MKTETSLLNIVGITLRVLTFRATAEQLARLGNAHLAFGLICTWIAGIGRSWDDVGASLLRKSGIGSVGYIFALSLLLWLVIAPLCQGRTDYKRILTFVSLTSPLGMLYAIPVEQFLARETSLQINVMFLTFVASWRVALLAFYFRRGAGLTWSEVVLSTLFPLSIIMAPLTILKAAHEVLSTMGGLRENGAPDTMAMVLGHLGTLSVWAFLPLLFWHQMAMRSGGHKN